VAVRPGYGSDNYNKRPGTASVNGVRFEKAVPLLVCLRCLNKNTPFRLAVNVDNTGSLDDMVIRCDFQPGVYTTYFVQLKHKDSGTASYTSTDFTQLSGPLSLLCFFQSYCLIRKRHGNVLQSCGSFKNFDFIIYTNAKVECGTSHTFKAGHPLDTLSTASESRRYEYITLSDATDIVKHLEELELCKKVLLCNSEPIGYQSIFTSKEIQNNLENETLLKKLLNCDFAFTKDFLNKLKILHRQSPVSGVEDSISTELENYAQNAPSSRKQIKKYFSRWFDKTETAEWLTGTSYVWQKAILEQVPQIEGPTLSVAAWPAEPSQYSDPNWYNQTSQYSDPNWYNQTSQSS
jgi:hypothetical protein